MEKVELRLAYSWDCDHCWRENFCNGITPEMSEEDAKEMREEHGIESYDLGHWMLMPEKVKCQHCGAEFETEHFNDDNESESSP